MGLPKVFQAKVYARAEYNREDFSMNRHANLIMLEQVASHLGTLLDEVVFVGGAVTSTLIL
ncbi:MAG: hypothetical protein DRR16_15675 [Candidatus Parabeggiatoa sp. nov. 3]|nr:MAG: hypothetical protein DRR00_09550 [Gammaproteobacteria bacterium]RKZ67944.1 MAG: hypothetical protein DRQ99_05260 [Gammaproteobacteria bacterium]RKZ84090.1 MAG: hypothetical protein DRR16_15675 [Gammaproteobacteria bacterium]